MSRYTVVTHHTGCQIVEGESIPVTDAAALLTAWAKRGEADDPVECDTRLPAKLTAASAVHVVLVVGRRSELAELEKIYP